MATLLQIIQDITNELGLQEPTTVIDNSNRIAKQLLAIAHRIGDELIYRVQWPELQKQTTITLVASQANYALPADYDRQIPRTHWDRDNTWELEGPLSPQEWEWRQEGLSATSPKRRFRVKGSADNEFYVDPTPAAGDAGTVLVYEYISKTWIYPTEWTSGDTYADGAYVSYNGNIYKCTTGGTAGATAPTHTSGSSSDDTISWTYQDMAYNRFLADTDEPVFDDMLLSMGIMARFMWTKGLQNSVYGAKFEELISSQAITKKGAKTLNMTTRRNPLFIGSSSVPDTGWGS